MSPYPLSISPFGEQAILLKWPDRVEEEILDDILQFVAHLKAGPLTSQEWEFVPAYNSLALIQREGEPDFHKLNRELRIWYAEAREAAPREKFLWLLPVCYDREFGIDLEELALRLGLAEQEVVRLHTGSIYTVYGIGFLPGFMYLGGVPEVLQLVRKENPRPVVPQGAVGIAGRQTGIYPQDSPGGWNIIGNCPVPVFNPAKDPPCLVSIGDRIQFYPIKKSEHELYKIQAEVGIYSPDKIKLDA